jgi:hypothetical protein
MIDGHLIHQSTKPKVLCHDGSGQISPHGAAGCQNSVVPDAIWKLEQF